MQLLDSIKVLLAATSFILSVLVLMNKCHAGVPLLTLSLYCLVEVIPKD